MVDISNPPPFYPTPRKNFTNAFDYNHIVMHSFAGGTLLQLRRSKIKGAVYRAVWSRYSGITPPTSRETRSTVQKLHSSMKHQESRAHAQRLSIPGQDGNRTTRCGQITARNDSRKRINLQQVVVVTVHRPPWCASPLVAIHHKLHRVGAL